MPVSGALSCILFNSSGGYNLQDNGIGSNPDLAATDICRNHPPDWRNR